MLYKIYFPAGHHDWMWGRPIAICTILNDCMHYVDLYWRGYETFPVAAFFIPLGPLYVKVVEDTTTDTDNRINLAQAKD